MLTRRLGLAVAFLVFAPPAAEISFAPSEGLTLTKTFHQAFRATLDSQDAVVVMNGEERAIEQPTPDMKLEEDEDAVFVDEYVAVGDGRVTKLKRTFKEISSRSETVVEDGPGEKNGESALEGLTVLFSWDPDEEEYTASYDGEAADEDLLDGLEAEVDLAELLPDGDVAVGDTWDVDIEAFHVISDPGGDLAVVMEDDDGEDDDFDEQFEENMEGELTGEYVGTEDVDGRELQVIKITGELETTVEQETDPEQFGGQGEGTQTFEFTIEVEARLYWDSKAGHARSFSGESVIGLSIETHHSAEQNGMEFEIRLTQEFSGTVTDSITFE